MCRLLLATIELSNRGGLSIRYTRKGKGFICRVYIYACMYVRSSFFLIRSGQRLKLNLRAKCTRCFIEDHSPRLRCSIERYIYIYISFLFRNPPRFHPEINYTSHCSQHANRKDRGELKVSQKILIFVIICKKKKNNNWRNIRKYYMRRKLFRGLG